MSTEVFSDLGPIPPSGKEDNAPPKRFTSTELDVLPEFDPLKSTLSELLHSNSNVNENRNHGNHDLLQPDRFSGPPGAFPPPSTRPINSRIPSSTTVSTGNFLYPSSANLTAVYLGKSRDKILSLYERCKIHATFYGAFY